MLSHDSSQVNMLNCSFLVMAPHKKKSYCKLQWIQVLYSKLLVYQAKLSYFVAHQVIKEVKNVKDKQTNIVVPFRLLPFKYHSFLQHLDLDPEDILT